ncbi:MAG: glycosyltransferase [Victivallaceae bacterium]
MPQVSIVMRSMNDIQYIEKTLKAIFNQKFTNFELINIDSGSTDGTCEIIEKYNPGKFFKIKPEEYIPGVVLNNAIRECAGEIIVFNNSDCIPQNSDWLGNLICPLLDIPQIAASFGNQEPRPDAKPLVRKDHLRAFGDGIISASWEHFFSLATSAALKEVLIEHPFAEDLQYSEDIEWSYRMKKHGYIIAYVPDAIVEHSHNYSQKALWKRFYNEGLAEGRIYGRRKMFLRGFLLPWLLETARDCKYLIGCGNVTAIPGGVAYRFRQRLAAWKGRGDYFKNSRTSSGEHTAGKRV